jgi:hypothetical protein
MAWMDLSSLLLESKYERSANGRSHEKLCKYLVYNTFVDCAKVALCTEEASQLQSSEFHFSEVFHMEHDENEVPVLEMLSPAVQCSAITPVHL